MFEWLNSKCIYSLFNDQRWTLKCSSDSEIDSDDSWHSRIRLAFGTTDIVNWSIFSPWSNINDLKKLKWDDSDILYIILKAPDMFIPRPKHYIN